jgi:hypothetical protein
LSTNTKCKFPQEINLDNFSFELPEGKDFYSISKHGFINVIVFDGLERKFHKNPPSDFYLESLFSDES